MTTLETALFDAGVRDPDLAQLARKDVPTAQAVDELRRRFPAAFAPPPVFDARTATAADRTRQWEAIQKEEFTRTNAALQKEEFTRLTARFKGQPK